MILLKAALQNAYLACNYVPIEALPSIHWQYFTACLHKFCYMCLLPDSLSTMGVWERD